MNHESSSLDVFLSWLSSFDGYNLGNERTERGDLPVKQHMTYKQVNRAPLRYRSAEHGPACLARSARSQTIGRFAPS